MESYRLASFKIFFHVIARNQAGLASWTCGLCSPKGLCAQKGSVLGLMFCCQHLEILDNFIFDLIL